MIISKEEQEKMIGLTFEELGFYILDSTDLGICDKCEKIEWSGDLNWFEDISKSKQLYWEQHLDGDTLCDDCYKS